ncbi:hypothetical protein SERLA73DRAFT_149274 [Serpula lacrymans var. lacrymans S7.3]|uniref:Uncharacterized protein n=1 Tax=Serpula lacrymans var. lacrymans (strain S7.3) TaxID=936435 RepID=F8PHC7_SERL3|nr:hypothetical protein SERLA73DRAFT_149274 [Serpula lacrymans var. lacrymans S7.3]
MTYTSIEQNESLRACSVEATTQVEDLNARIMENHSSQQHKHYFEYAETAVKGLFSKKTVNTQLYGIHNGWARDIAITFHSYNEMENTLRAACSLCVQFQNGHVSAKFLGKKFNFEFVYRDPWQVYQNWITDRTLAPFIMPYPTRKYFCSQNGRIVIKIPNASGNGGGVLIGYMAVPADPGDPSDRNAFETVQWACFKREVYHKVFRVIFKSLQERASHGEAMECGDEVKRITYPGIPIKALDGGEICATTATRAALANYPCPKLGQQQQCSKYLQIVPKHTIEARRSISYKTMGFMRQRQMGKTSLAATP